MKRNKMRNIKVIETMTKDELIKLVLQNSKVIEKNYAKDYDEILNKIDISEYNFDYENLFIFCMESNNIIIKMLHYTSAETNSVNFNLLNVIKDIMNSPMTSKVIMAHNHPTGSLTPSQADCNSTRRLFASMSVLGLDLIDSLIFNNCDVYSMKVKRPKLFVTVASKLKKMIMV
ncbi:MAG: hypothetical protein PF638_13900 [Candidatus Delongbacteria bacterium]|jgi:DNA repair protein RadC|nr:hypothetical protein [Candidatus Delongbacteria bacterium]